MTIAIIILTIFLVCKLFLKVDRSMTYCGIFAFSGIKNIDENQIKLAVNKMKVLGMYNESRGGQGAGIFLNNEIMKCGDKYKTFPALMEANLFQDSVENHIMIGHCRKSSRGAVSFENSHPFLINEDLVGVHNGTIENIYALATKYNIDSTGIFSDSKILFSIIEARDIEILNEYKGSAALIWSRMSEPNTMYVYHGASKNYASGNPIEERPLFYMKAKEGIYLSSLADSLWGIRDEEDQVPEVLETNTVFKLNRGRFTSSKRTIAREEANVYVYTPPATTTGYSTRGDYTDYEDVGTGCRTRNRAMSQIGSATAAMLNRSAPIEPLVWRETIPTKVDESVNFKRVYFHKGRYYTKPGAICHGKIQLLSKGIVADERMIAQSTPYYFYDGVMIDSEEKYKLLMHKIQNRQIILGGRTSNFAMAISEFSRFPVTNRACECQDLEDIHRYKWYKSHKPCNEAFTPKFSNRSYKIKAGYLYDICNNSSSDKTPTLFDTYEEAGSVVKPSQAIIPFKPDTVSIPHPILDQVHTNYETLVRSIPSIYMKALSLFAQELMITFMSLDPDEEEVREEVARMLKLSIAEKISIRVAFGAKVQQIEDYVQTLAKEDMYSVEEVDSPPGQAYSEAVAEAQLEQIEEVVNSLTEAQEQLEDEEDQKANDLEQANEVVEDIVKLIEELNERTNELTLNESKFAKECSTVLTRSLDGLKWGLTNAANNHSTNEIQAKINNTSI